jgi:IS5 family transposase
VETNIHRPTDSTLLQDGIRIITRWLGEGQELSPRPVLITTLFGESFNDLF